MSTEDLPMRLVVAIYADYLLLPSMTFVRAQAEALEKFTPIYVGSRRYGAGGLNLPEDRVLALHQSASALGKIREFPLKILGYDPILFWKVKRRKPVLVHAHFGPGGLLALPLSRYLNVPLITTFHGYDVTVGPEHAQEFHFTFRKYCRNKALLQREGRLFLAASQFVRDKLIEQGFPEHRVRLHYIGVDTEFFQPNLSIQREQVVLFVGRLSENKGCRFLIEAFEHVRAVHPKIALVVIGDGPERPFLESIAKRNLGDVRFLGMQPPSVVRSWMRRARVFSMPSVEVESGNSEGFGLVFAEALACGLPAVSFATGGIPEVVADGRTGFLVRPRDSIALAARILRLLVDDSLWNAMSLRGRQLVCERFDLRRQTRILEEIYTELQFAREAPKESTCETQPQAAGAE